MENGWVPSVETPSSKISHQICQSALARPGSAFGASSLAAQRCTMNLHPAPTYANFEGWEELSSVEIIFSWPMSKVSCHSFSKGIVVQSKCAWQGSVPAPALNTNLAQTIQGLHLASSASRTASSSRRCTLKEGFSPAPSFSHSYWGNSWNTHGFAQTPDSAVWHSEVLKTMLPF